MLAISQADPDADLALCMMGPAEYLSQALETGRALDVAVALFDIAKGGEGDLRAFELGYNLRLHELMEILDRAGLRLVAVRAEDPGDRA